MSASYKNNDKYEMVWNFLNKSMFLIYKINDKYEMRWNFLNKSMFLISYCTFKHFLKKNSEKSIYVS